MAFQYPFAQRQAAKGNVATRRASDPYEPDPVEQLYNRPGRATGGAPSQPEEQPYIPPPQRTSPESSRISIPTSGNTRPSIARFEMARRPGRKNIQAADRRDVHTTPLGRRGLY